MARGSGLSWLAWLSLAALGCSSADDGGVGAFGGFSGTDGGPGGSASTASGGSSAGAGESGAGSGGTSGSAASGGSGATGGSGAVLGFDDLAFVKPTEYQVHLQSGTPALANVSFEVLAGPGIGRVKYVIENDFELGESTAAPGFALSYDYQWPGNRWARALGFDANDAQIAEALVNFVVQAPAASSCFAQLDQLGVAYTKSVAKGVVDAVKLNGPLNGILFAKTNTDVPSTDPMGCEFVHTLWKFAELLKARGFVKVGTLGAYCYRCCCAWSETNYCRGPNDPEPDCSVSGYSNHSFGRALDVRWLYKKTGEVYDINDPKHWVTWPVASETCTKGLAAQTGISKELYTVACDSAAQKIFSILLTPNYNSSHRNHLHADIGQSGAASGFKVLKSELPAVDVAEHGDE
jgi:hypothetical protein